jgi:hypothetical protein
MIKNVLFFLSIFSLTLGIQYCDFRQSENLPDNIKEKLYGDWSEKKSHLPYSFCFTDSLATCFYLHSDFGLYKVNNDTLIISNKFTERYYKKRVAKFNILILNDTLLKLSFRRIGPGEDGKLDTIDLYKFSPLKVNDDIYMERIVIRTTPCYGDCPVYNFEINIDRNCYFQGIVNVDSIGNYRGMIDLKHLNLINRIIKYINYDDLKDSYSSSITCSQTISLVIYLHNSKTNKTTKYFTSIYGNEAPVELQILLNYLIFANQYVVLHKTKEVHSFECKKEDKEYYDEMISYYKNIK